MEILGYIASIFIGISLGLIGGGGSILTVPVLVYLFGTDALLATTYSLFIVGTTSLAGSATYFKQGLVDIRTAIVFGIPSIISIWIARTYLVPSIPEIVFSWHNFELTKSVLLLLLFAILMLFASYSMIKRKSNEPSETPKTNNTSKVVVQGFFVGIVTGLVGAGGGFLIIPALVNILRLPMKTAVGTSLLIITINSLIGFLFSLSHATIEWPFLITVATIALAGILIGAFLSKKIDGKLLKPAFGWFVLVMGMYILVKEMFFN